MKRIFLLLLFALTISSIVNAETTPQSVVASFGKYMSEWCKTEDISYREKIEALCNGNKECRVEDKILANFQTKPGLTDYRTFVLGSYLNIFQSMMSQNIQFQMKNIKIHETDIMLDGALSFVTADIDIKMSGLPYLEDTYLFLVRDNKITGIYTYSSKLGFSHLNGIFSDP